MRCGAAGAPRSLDALLDDTRLGLLVTERGIHPAERRPGSVVRHVARAELRVDTACSLVQAFAHRLQVAQHRRMQVGEVGQAACGLLARNALLQPQLEHASEELGTRSPAQRLLELLRFTRILERRFEGARKKLVGTNTVAALRGDVA